MKKIILTLALFLSIAASAASAQDRVERRGYFPYGAPEDCRGREVCVLTGDGGDPLEWISRFTASWVRWGKPIVVQGQCMSACAMAVGYALAKAPHLVTIRDSARIRPHNVTAIRDHGWPMPEWYKRMLLRDLRGECTKATCPTITGREVNRALGR